MGVYIGQPIVISDMQGPCPDELHIPLKSDWEALSTEMGTLGIGGGNNFRVYLKLPNGGYRWSNGQIFNQGNMGFYWLSSAYTNNYGWYYNSSESGIRDEKKIFGMLIRAFKNSPTIPNNNWTVLYQGTGDAGVFHNSSLGLISISSDGENWITIADKNIGATNVYNDGDGLNENNCGYYFQRGNNYGFPRTGGVTTSGSQVNASTYGPGNYYNSNIFITANPRDSSGNNNLRGGVSQGTSTKPTELKNAYIGEYRVPGSNTIAYYPLKDDFNDYSGNGYNLTVSNATITNLNGVSCGLYSNGRAYNATPTVGSTRTLVAWFYNQTSGVLVGTGANQSGYSAIMMSNNGDKIQISDFYATGYSSSSISSNSWHLGVAIADGANMYIYVDGVLANSGTHSNTLNSTGVSAGGKPFTSQYTDYFSGYLSNVIIENKARTAQEISHYYDITKSNYGL